MRSNFLHCLCQATAWLALISPADAVFTDEAFHVDYHFALLGLPNSANTFFHRPDPNNKGSLLYTLSELNVLGAVHPRDGSLVWRHNLQGSNKTQEVGRMRAVDGQDTLLSLVGQRLDVWSAIDGKLAWSWRPQPAEDVHGAEMLETGDVVVLSGNGRITKLERQSGTVQWENEGSTSGDIPYSLAATKTDIYAISLSSSMLKGRKIKVTKLDAQSGEKEDIVTLNSDSEISTLDDILRVTSKAHAPVIVWTDPSRSVVKANVLGGKTVASFAVDSPGRDTKITVHAASEPACSAHFLVSYETVDAHWADVFHITEASGAISKVYGITKAPSRGAFAASCSDGQVYFTQVTGTGTKLFSATAPLVEFPIASFDVPGIVPTEELAVVGIASDVVAKSPTAHAVRSAVLLSTGDWVLVQNGQPQWTRHESLASIVRADFADLVDDQPLQGELLTEERSNVFSAYIHRVTRHLIDLQHLPELIQSAPQRISAWATNFIDGQGASKSASFGFDKLVIVETSNGRIIALRPDDSGQVLFNSMATAGAESLSSSIKDNAPSWWALTDKKSLALAFESTSKTSYDEPDLSTYVTYALTHGEIIGKHQGKEVWRFTPLPGFRVMSVHTTLLSEPVASIGKALADRRVLYKYLNKNALVVIATNESGQQISISLLDAVSGEVLYITSHKDVDISRPIPVAASENWFTYSFVTTSVQQGSHGYQLVMTELYESEIPNDRGPLGSAADFNSSGPLGAASTAHRPYVSSQIYHVPEEISALGVTQTSQGITSRQLLAVLPGSGSIVGIPRQVLDPRRTVGKDPSSGQQMEEDLIRYQPFFDFDPRWQLTHTRDVWGITDIMTSSTLMESTGLVFAYGLDVFGTRISPSGPFDILGASFNKVQLILTVLGLCVGVIGVKPLVGRKQTNALWQA